MKPSFDSVYPDFLRTGLDRLNQAESRHELISLFAALEQFRRDLHAQENQTVVLEVSHRYEVDLHQPDAGALRTAQGREIP